MKYIWNFFKWLFITCLILFIAAAAINSQTDVFFNIGAYIPALEEKYPQAADKISELSQKLADITSSIPTPSEIIADIRNEDLPIDPEDLASNAYITDSPMLSFYPHDNLSVRIPDGEGAEVFGITDSPLKRNLIAYVMGENGFEEQTPFSVNSSGEFYKYIKLPDTGSTLKLDVYTGSRPYGEFQSWVYDYITLERTPEGVWQVKQSPVLEHNQAMYEKDKSLSDALKSTPSIQSKNDSVTALASQITENAQSDYDKALFLHDWICTYLYYDTDNLNSEVTVPYYATEVIENQSAVCLGFATLYAALCRSIGIPCNVVSGYALGISSDTEWTDANIGTDVQNHAWNEVYADGRWVIVDTTWDCVNKIENGERIKGGEPMHIYFDANLSFFSQNHKILEYMRRR
ncbi:MAG: transglutaminase-like domain-containing protein [Clostridiales bacterium]|nr:transglutaminase-like domain-containing protein [Clostridiales bacterium]